MSFSCTCLIRRSTVIRMAVLVALAAQGGPVWADAASDRITELEKKLERALGQIEELNRKVQRLEHTPAASPAAAPAMAPAADPSLNARVTEVEDQLSAIANRPAPDLGIPVHGFADVGLGNSTLGQPKGANLGTFDIYLTPTIGARVKSLIEMAFEVDTEGKMEVDLERLQLGYSFSDQLTLWGGRFHTPYGYWNTAFHHGAQIQTSISRPKFLEFEDRGGVLPAHTVGAWGSGGLRLGDGRLNYDAYVGNSDRIILNGNVPGSGTLDPNMLGTTNHSAIVGGSLSYNLNGSLKGLKVGVDGFRFKVDDDAQPARNKTSVRALGAFAAYLENEWEVMSEYYHFNNEDLSGNSGTHRSSAGYLQVGRAFNAWTPYARIERTGLDQNDNYFAQLAGGWSYRRGVLGLRFDLNPTSALKLEFHRTQPLDRGMTDYNEARLQFAVRF